MHFDENDVDGITSLLMGRRITKIDDERLQLDDGTMLTLIGNDGGCACGSGDYTLTELNGCDNVITNVELVNAPGGDDYDDGNGTYRIFVFADNQRINLATFEGTDGNGYYGTGYRIKVKKPA